MTQIRLSVLFLALTSCHIERPEEASLHAVGSATVENGEVSHSFVFSQEIDGEEFIRYRRCQPLPVELDRDSQDAFDLIKGVDTECLRSVDMASAESELIAEQSAPMAVNDYRNNLVSALRNLNYDSAQALPKADSLIQMIRTPLIQESRLKFKLVSLPFLGQEQLNFKRIECEQPCEGEECWVCSPSQGPQVSCKEENDARLVALNRCQDGQCLIHCEDQSVAVSDDLPELESTSCQSQCNPDTESCLQCRCWGGGLDLQGAQFCPTLAAARSAFSATCGKHIYCETVVHPLDQIEREKRNSERVSNGIDQLLNLIEHAQEGYSLYGPSWNPLSSNFYPWHALQSHFNQRRARRDDGRALQKFQADNDRFYDTLKEYKRWHGAPFDFDTWDGNPLMTPEDPQAQSFLHDYQQRWGNPSTANQIEYFERKSREPPPGIWFGGAGE